MTQGLINNYRLEKGACRYTCLVLNLNRINTSSIQIGNEIYLVLINLVLVEKLSTRYCSSFDPNLENVLFMIKSFDKYSKTLSKIQLRVIDSLTTTVLEKS